MAACYVIDYWYFGIWNDIIMLFFLFLFPPIIHIIYYSIISKILGKKQQIRP